MAGSFVSADWKFRWNVMEKAVMNHCRSILYRDVLGDAKKDSVQILMAHNPMFAKEYAEWGADVSVCGHTHGGLVRIPGIGSVISPQFELFPKYDAGEFNFGRQKSLCEQRFRNTYLPYPCV